MGIKLTFEKLTPKKIFVLVNSYLAGEEDDICGCAWLGAVAEACSLLASPPLTPKGRSGRKYRSLFQNPASFHRITAEEEAFIRRLNSGAAARSREVSSS